MAGKHLESFNTHLGATEMGRRYAVATNASGISTGSQVLTKAGSIGVKSDGLVLGTRALVVSATNVWISGARFWMRGNLTGSPTFTAGMSFSNSVGVQVYWIPVKVDTYRYNIEIRRGSTNTLLGTAGPFFYDKEIYIEFKSTVRTSTNGSYELRVNGVSASTVTGINTAGQGSDGADRMTLSWVGSSAPEVVFADWYICDDASGGPVDFVGPTSLILGGTATSDGDTLDWVPSTAGAHFSKVNEGPSLFNDGTFVVSEVVNDIDLYHYVPSSLASIGTGSSLKLVSLTSMAAMQASGTADMRGRYKDPGTSQASFGTAATLLNTTQIAHSFITHQNPVTSVAWSAADITTGQFGPVRV